MKVTVFSKRIAKKDGSKFTGYITKLHNKVTGEDDYCRIRFNDSCEIPQVFPVILEVGADSANLSQKHVRRDDGTEYTQRTLWISAYTLSNEKYVDHSMDMYE